MKQELHIAILIGSLLFLSACGKESVSSQVSLSTGESGYIDPPSYDDDTEGETGYLPPSAPEPEEPAQPVESVPDSGFIPAPVK